MCLQINDLHLPSIKSLADLYEKLDDENQAEYYRKLSKTIMDKLMDRKIEEEVRKHYRLGN
jgi:transcription elongation factor GreA-like protein